MQHFISQQKQAYSRKLNKVSLILGQASQKISSRSILKIKEHNNGTPAQEKTRTTINQRETYRYRPGRQENKNVVFCTTFDPSATKEGDIYSYICGRLPNT